MNKRLARVQALTYRNNLNETYRDSCSNIIVSKIKQNKKFNEAKYIGLYYPFGSEVDLRELASIDKQIGFPRMNGDVIDFILVNNDTKWEINKFGINEPISGIIINDKIELLVVSSLAKNNNNYRLGYGKGYYDKFILKYKPYTIGVLFDSYMIEFDNDYWDIPLNEYISN